MPMASSFSTVAPVTHSGFGIQLLRAELWSHFGPNCECRDFDL